MTARPHLPSDSSDPATDPQPAPVRLRIALALAFLGALLTGLGPLAGLVAPGASAAYPSWPLLLVLALIPPVLAVLMIRRGESAAGTAVLVGAAVLVPGRIGADLQFAVDPGGAARPEVLLLHELAHFTPALGFWLLLAGHLAVLLAGLFALHRSGHESGVGTQRQGVLALVLCAGVLGAIGVLMAPFRSDNPFLVVEHALDGPLPVLVGSALLAIAAAGGAGLLAGSTDPEVARGGLLGVAAGLLAVAVPPLVSVLVLEDLRFEWGPVLVLLAALALAALGVQAGRAAAPESDPEDLRLPALTRLLTLAGAFALLAGAVAVLAAITPHVSMPFGLRDPSAYPARMLWPAGAVLLVVGAGLLVPSAALRLRPVLPVVWVVLPLAAAGSLDAVFTAVQAIGAQVGIGAWASGLALLPAAIAAVLATIAGAVERDDVDLTEMAMRRSVLVPSLLALVLGAGAFSFPVLTAPDYTAPGVFTAFGTTSWGLVLAMAAVVGATVLAPMCRPQRAAALLCGAALVVAVRVVQYPLTSDRLSGSAAGIGLWFGIACLVVLLGTAVAAARAPKSTG